MKKLLFVLITMMMAMNFMGVTLLFHAFIIDLLIPTASLYKWALVIFFGSLFAEFLLIWMAKQYLYITLKSLKTFFNTVYITTVFILLTLVSFIEFHISISINNFLVAVFIFCFSQSAILFPLQYSKN